MGQYLPIFALLVLAMLFGAGSFVASKLLAPRLPTSTKLGPYECGIVPGREPPQRFSVRFYLVAMIFIVFDIEVIFLFPYATVVNQVGVFGFVAVLVFSVALFESFLYLIGSGALDWGPVARRVAPGLVTPERTTATTVRRVGAEGRTPVGASAAAGVAGDHGAAA
jgi:NADH-quinone oxidoreductase subunit A